MKTTIELKKKNFQKCKMNKNKTIMLKLYALKYDILLLFC